MAGEVCLWGSLWIWDYLNSPTGTRSKSKTVTPRTGSPGETRLKPHGWGRTCTGFEQRKLQTHILGEAAVELHTPTGSSWDLATMTMMSWNFPLFLQKGKKSQASVRVHVCLQMHMNSKFLLNSSPTPHIPLLQAPAMVEVGRELWRSPRPPLLQLFWWALAKTVLFDCQYWFLQKQATIPSSYSTYTYGKSFFHRNEIFA